jgi:hypothetical protein
MKDIFKQLIDSKIDWKELPDSPHLQSVFQNKVVKLRFNDFPDEVLCTIIIDDEEQDWDELPSNWTLPEDDSQY